MDSILKQWSTIFVLPFFNYFLINKDHQTMIVDPMFMIVQNVWLFLTAVTSTAVAPTAVILKRNFR